MVSSAILEGDRREGRRRGRGSGISIDSFSSRLISRHCQLYITNIVQNKDAFDASATCRYSSRTLCMPCLQIRVQRKGIAGYTYWNKALVPPYLLIFLARCNKIAWF